MTGPGLPIAPALLERFRAAGAQIQWRDAAPPKKGRRPTARVDRVRIAHLNDEEARILEGRDGRVVAESGPVGALVVLLAIDRAGPPSVLRARAAGEEPGFDQGAIEARWPPAPAAGPTLPIADLVQVARYALA